MKVIGTDLGRIRLRFNYLNTKEEKVLAESGLKHTALLQRKGAEKDGKEYELKRDGDTNSSWFTPDFLVAETECVVKVRVKFKDKGLKWSEGVEFTPPKFSECCVWKKCPDYVDVNRKYSVDEKNPRVATKINSWNGDSYSTIIGNTPLPQNKVTSWSIKSTEVKR